MVVAHRGASATHKENTVAAFEAARHQGAGGIELDVRRSADDVLVVHHDAHLADGRLISELQSAELPDWVPTLAETLDVTSNMWLNVEIKNLPDEPDYDVDDAISVAVAGLVTAHLDDEVDQAVDGDDARDLAAALHERVLVSSFNVDNIERIRSVEPRIPVGLLVWGQVDPSTTISRVLAHGFEAIHPHDLMVDAAFVDKARSAGLAINVWTVDEPSRILELARLGVDSIITNWPDRASQALDGAGLL